MFVRHGFVPSLQLAFYAIIQELWDFAGVFSLWSLIQLSLRKYTGPQLGNGVLAGNKNRVRPGG
jgi:hypothetical protein